MHVNLFLIKGSINKNTFQYFLAFKQKNLCSALWKLKYLKTTKYFKAFLSYSDYKLFLELSL